MTLRGHLAGSGLSAGTTTRVRGMADWHPQRVSLALLEQVQSVLIEYARYLPLTVRQIFYRMVGAHGYTKTEQAYSRLGECLNRARRSRMIEFSAIRDDGITLAEPLAWDGPKDLVDAFLQQADTFRLDRQHGQRRRLIFAIEAAGMVPQVQRITDPFGIPVHSCGGFDSLTAKRDLAVRLGEYPRVEVLHVGDHDPSGVHLYLSMAEDVRQIARDLGLGVDIRFTRLAVTPSQIAELGLPTAPPKATDRRAFEGETVQGEAIPPDRLAEIVRKAIDVRVDPDALAQVFDREKDIRRRLMIRLDPLSDGWEDAP
jgi:hypothetical protein